jgi:hypothetical protein
MSEQPRLECRYCGAPIQKGRSCRLHAELERNDPAALAEQPPASEHELGVRPQWRVPKRGGRGELY